MVPESLEVLRCNPSQVLATTWDVTRRPMGQGQEWSGLISAACAAQKGRIGVNLDGTRWR